MNDEGGVIMKKRGGNHYECHFIGTCAVDCEYNCESEQKNRISSVNNQNRIPIFNGKVFLPKIGTKYRTK